jgi:hypothetical protein
MNIQHPASVVAQRLASLRGAAGALLNWARQAWNDLATEMFEQNGLDTVFAHARNVLTGALIVAAGMYAAHHLGDTQLPGMWTVHVAGYAVAALGAVLLALNLADGLHRLAKRKHPLLLRLAAILIYVALSIRLAQVIVYFRAAA